MGIEKLMEKARIRTITREINKLISACERGDDIFDALIVEPLSDLDTRQCDGWIRPDGFYYEDYIFEPSKNSIVFFVDSDRDSIGSHETTIQQQIELDKEYRDWQTPSGTLHI